MRHSKLSPQPGLAGLIVPKGAAMSILDDINRALRDAGAAYQMLKRGGGPGEWVMTKFTNREKITPFLSVLWFLGIPPWSLEKDVSSVSDHIMLESNDTAVVIIVVNDTYVITTQQHRPICSRWVIEATRGWYQKKGGAREIVQRKVPNLLGDPERGIDGIADLDEDTGIVTIVPPVWEDTGLRTNKISYFIVHTTCDIPEVEGQSEHQTLRRLLTEVGNDMYRVFVHTVEEIDTHLIELMAKRNPNQNRGFIEAISIAAWTAFHFYRTHRDRIAAAST